MSVPPFQQYWPTESSLDGEQLAFYRYLEKQAERGVGVDVEGSVSYIFIYAYKKVEQAYYDGLEACSEVLKGLEELFYREKKFTDYAKRSRGDCLLGLQRWEEYLEHSEEELVFEQRDSNQRLTVQEHLGLPADPMDLLLALTIRWTPLIKENQVLYKRSVREVFGETAPNGQIWFDYLNEFIPKEEYSAHTLLRGLLPNIDALGSSIRGNNEHDALILKLPVKCWYALYINDPNEELILLDIKQLEKKARNSMRSYLNLPHIGEGWVSETKLYNQVKEAFPQTVVIHHGQPPWLGRQHFDIWIPRWRIAVEYQGAQHFESVDFFGGEEALQKTKERDERKRRLAESHSVHLIEVFPGYVKEEVLDQISSIRKL